jgi:hypothetical protein
VILTTREFSRYAEAHRSLDLFGVWLLDLIAIGRFSFVWRGPRQRLRSDLGEPLQDYYSLPHSPRRDSSSGTLVESWNESLQ